MCVRVFSLPKSHLTEHAIALAEGLGSIITTKLSQTVYKVASCCQVVGEYRNHSLNIRGLPLVFNNCTGQSLAMVVVTKMH